MSKTLPFFFDELFYSMKDHNLPFVLSVAINTETDSPVAFLHGIKGDCSLQVLASGIDYSLFGQKSQAYFNCYFGLVEYAILHKIEFIDFHACSGNVKKSIGTTGQGNMKLVFCSDKKDTIGKLRNFTAKLEQKYIDTGVSGPNICAMCREW